MYFSISQAPYKETSNGLREVPPPWLTYCTKITETVYICTQETGRSVSWRTDYALLIGFILKPHWLRAESVLPPYVFTLCTPGWRIAVTPGRTGPQPPGMGALLFFDQVIPAQWATVHQLSHGNPLCSWCSFISSASQLSFCTEHIPVTQLCSKQ